MTLLRFQIKTEYSFGSSFTPKGIAFRGLTDQGWGSKPDPSGVRQAPQIARVRDCMDVPYKLPSNAEFETSYAVFKASRGCLEGDPIEGERRALGPYRMGPSPA